MKSMEHKSKRRLVREKVMQVLFAYEMNDESLQLLKSELLTDIDSSHDRDFADKLINEVLKNSKILDELIKKRVTVLYRDLPDILSYLHALTVPIVLQ